VSRCALVAFFQLFNFYRDWCGGKDNKYGNLVKERTVPLLLLLSSSKQSTSNRSLSEKHSFDNRLGEVWQDLQDNAHWKYEQLFPVQLLERSERHVSTN
jgi:hypothetical protein